MRRIFALLAFLITASAFAQSVPVKNAVLQGTLNGTPTGGTLNLGSVTVTLGFADGSTAAPAIKFSSDTDTGFYRIGSNNIGITAGNTLVGAWSTTGLTLGGALATAVGSASSPILSFGATGDGFYTPADNQIGIGIGGSSVAVMSASALTLGTNVSVAFAGTGAATTLTNLGATTVGANLLKLTNPGAVTFLRLNADNTVTARSASDFRSDIGLGSLATQNTPVCTSYTRNSGTQTLTNGTAVALAFPTAVKTDASFNGTTFTAPSTAKAVVIGTFDLNCTAIIGSAERGDLTLTVRDTTSATNTKIIYDTISVYFGTFSGSQSIATTFTFFAPVSVTSGHAYQIFCTWDNGGDDATTSTGSIQWEIKL